jgi:hypothetical protein
VRFIRSASHGYHANTEIPRDTARVTAIRHLNLLFINPPETAKTQVARDGRSVAVGIRSGEERPGVSAVRVVEAERLDARLGE